jgi:myo-inositol-1(or 4)-monophosphatase
MYVNELEVAVQAANAAAIIVRELGRDRSCLGIRSKEKFDLVTDADLASEKIIRKILTDAFPNDAILGEEESAEELTTGRRWIVDPIDGTTNFAHGFPPYCVSIALYDGSVPLVGVVLEIASGELFTATKGGGTKSNGVPTSVSAISEPSKALIGTGFPTQEGTDYTAMLKLAYKILSDTEGL